MDEELLTFNGVNGATGQAFIPPLSVTKMADCIFRQHLGLPAERQNRERNLYEKHDEGVLGVRHEFQGLEWDVAAVGWGVVYASDVPSEVKKEVEKLIAHRAAMKDSRGKKGREPRIYVCSKNQDADTFRQSRGQDFGVVDPDKMPYYLMIVGSPAEISFDFQHDLDVEHAVGRLYFGDAQGQYDVQWYRDYVDRVMAYENAQKTDRERWAAFFSPAKDKLTVQNADKLAGPLAKKIEGLVFETSKKEKVQYRTEWHRDTATRAKLDELLTRSERKPALLFTASHGLFLDSAQPWHAEDMGAFLCQDWEGSDVWDGGKIPDTKYFSGRHIDAGEGRFELGGLMVIGFACLSAGTPQTEALAQFHPELPAQLAEKPFVSYLPQRMLTRGTLAFVGHVGPAWSYSYAWPGVGFLTGNLEDVVRAILSGIPVGHATDFFNRRYLNLHHLMTKPKGLLDKYRDERPVDRELVRHWTARNDARGYIVLGDPAVHLRPEVMPEAST